MPTADDLLPLKSDIFHLLVELAEKPDYGYSLIRRVEEASGGRIRILTGTLYRRLEWMMARGLVEEAGREALEPGEDVRRQYYRITPLGRQVVGLEARRLSEVLSRPAVRELVDEGKA